MKKLKSILGILSVVFFASISPAHEEGPPQTLFKNGKIYKNIIHN